MSTRTHTQHGLALFLSMLAFLAPHSALAEEGTALDGAIAAYLDMAQKPGTGTVDGCSALEALVASYPGNPVYLAYAGACEAVAGRDAKTPEQQLELARRGIERVERALALLAPAHDAAELRGVPESAETRLVAAELLTALPRFFNRREAGCAAAAAALSSPAWERTPPALRARLERLATPPDAAPAPREALRPPLDPGVVATVAESATADFATLHLPRSVALVNNTWNKGAAEDDVAPFQEVFRGTGPGGDVFGWRWSWSERNTTVVAYPEAVLGTKPWDLGDAAFPRGRPFPFRAGARRITARYDAALAATGSYNLAFSLWAVTDLVHPRRSISHEIMIWTARAGALQPVGARIGELTVDGVRFEAWLCRDQADASGAAQNRWTYLAFVAEQPILKGSLDLSAFLDWSAQRGLLDRSSWITSVELGSEVVGGSGTLVLRRYVIEVR